MARIRYIKPGICSNEILGTGPVEYQFVFACLPMFADKKGRLEDRPMRLKAAIFPYRDGFDMEGALAWLNTNGFILRYAVQKFQYIQILTFDEHQKPHRHEPESVIPEPPMAVGLPPMSVDVPPMSDAIHTGNGERGMGNGNGELRTGMVPGHVLLGEGETPKGSPPGAYKHPVISRLREKRKHLRWVGIAGTGFENPENQSAEIAIVDDLVSVYGLERTIEAYQTATAGVKTLAEARKGARDYLAKHHPEKAAQRAKTAQPERPKIDLSLFIEEAQ